MVQQAGDEHGKDPRLTCHRNRPVLTTLAPMCTLRAVSLFLLMSGTWCQEHAARQQEPDTA